MEGESGGITGTATVPSPEDVSYADEADGSSDDEQPQLSDFDPYDYTDVADRFYACEIEEIPSWRWMTPSQRKIGPLPDVDLDEKVDEGPTGMPQRIPEGGEKLQIKINDLLSSKNEIEILIHQSRYFGPKLEVELWFLEVEKQSKEVQMLLNRLRSGPFARFQLRGQVIKKLKELDQLHEQQATWIDKYMIIELASIPVDEIKELTCNFGAASLVSPRGNTYRGILKNGTAVAIKKLVPGEQSDEEFLEKVFRLSRLKHENVAELIGYCVDGNIRALVREFATMGSLHDILHGQKGVSGAQPGQTLTWSQRVKIAAGVARGLEYLHNEAHPAVIHGGIKSSNVLIFEDDVAKIADFQFFNLPSNLDISPRYNDSRYNDFQVNIRYPRNATDCIIPAPPSSMRDVFDFGNVLLELLTGRKPSVPTPPVTVLRWCAQEKFNADKVKQFVDPRLGDDYHPKEASKLAAVTELCLHIDPECRPHMGIVVKALRPSLKSPPVSGGH